MPHSDENLCGKMPRSRAWSALGSVLSSRCRSRPSTNIRFGSCSWKNRNQTKMPLILGKAFGLMYPEDFSFWFLQVAFFKIQTIPKPWLRTIKINQKKPIPLSSLQRFQGLPFQLPQAQVAHLQSHNLNCSGEITSDFPRWHTSMRLCYPSVYDDMGTIKSMASTKNWPHDSRLKMPKSEKEHQVCCLHPLKSHQTFHNFRQAVLCLPNEPYGFLGLLLNHVVSHLV